MCIYKYKMDMKKNGNVTPLLLKLELKVKGLDNSYIHIVNKQHQTIPQLLLAM